MSPHINSSYDFKFASVFCIVRVRESVKRRFLISNVFKDKTFPSSYELSRPDIRVLHPIFRVPTSRTGEIYDCTVSCPFSRIFHKLDQKSKLHDREILKSIPLHEMARCE